MKEIYIVQPYVVGSKSAKVKSLALVIPASLREKTKIVASSKLMLQLGETSSQITINNIDEILEKYKNSPAGKNFPNYQQQESEIH